MPLFRWYRSYSVNNSELDEHHRRLFDIFNRLYDNCLENNMADCIGPIIEELLSYTDYHFAAEERHMREKGYMEAESHIEEHRGFTRRLSTLRESAGEDEPEATREVIALLGNWLLQHVIREDKKYAS